jgi:hypothetical protein
MMVVTVDHFPVISLCLMEAVNVSTYLAVGGMVCIGISLILSCVSIAMGCRLAGSIEANKKKGGSAPVVDPSRTKTE